MGKFKQKVSCPKCKSKDNVGVYLDGEKYNGSCFGCGATFQDIDPTDPKFDYRQWDGSEYEPPQQAALAPQPVGMAPAPYYHKETVEEIEQYPLAQTDRWAIEESKFFQVRASIGPNGQVDAVYYPHFNEEGRVRYYKKKGLADKSFSVIGSTSLALPFGMYGVPEQTPCLILTEGEDDAGAAKKMFRLYGKNYPCVSIPTGATMDAETGEGIIDKPLKAQLPRIASAKTVYLCLDQDSPGIALSKTLAEELAVHTDVKIMKLSEKDAELMHREGKAQEFWDAFCTAAPYVPEALVWAGDISMEELRRPLNEGLPLPLPELQAKMHGLRYGPGSGELTILTGGSGVGKSTLLRAVQQHVLVQASSVKVGTVYLEEQYTKSMQGMVAQYWKVPLPQLRANPGMLTLEQWKEAQAFYGHRQVFMKHFGSVASQKLLNKLYHMYRMGVQVIALDHISMVVAGQDSGSGGERKDIDKLMHGLANFCVVTGCHVIAIVHLKRGSREIRRDKEGNVNLEIAPYDMGGEITKTDLRGSGGLEQMADNIWAVEGDIYGTTERFQPNERWIRILKNREWNELGLAGMYEMNAKTGLLNPKRGTR